MLGAVVGEPEFVTGPSDIVILVPATVIGCGALGCAVFRMACPPVDDGTAALELGVGDEESGLVGTSILGVP